VNLHLEKDLFGLHLNIIALSLFLFINFGYTTYFFVVVFNSYRNTSRWHYLILLTSERSSERSKNKSTGK